MPRNLGLESETAVPSKHATVTQLGACLVVVVLGDVEVNADPAVGAVQGEAVGATLREMHSPGVVPGLGSHAHSRYTLSIH